MKKPNLRSIKGPNKAAKYAELMKKYRKYQSSICLLYTSDAADE